MCVIVFKPAKEKISKEDCRSMFLSNRDGAGLAYYKKDKIKVIKGLMTFEATWAVVNSLQHVDLVVHFRLCTHGLVNKHQTHPFVVNCDVAISKGLTAVEPKGVLFHNGIISGYGDDRVSDTIDFVTSVISRCEPTDLKIQVLELTGDKFALLEHGGIYLIGDFKEHEGLLCSNLHWDWSTRWQETKANTVVTQSRLLPLVVTEGFLTESEWYQLDPVEQEELELEYESIRDDLIVETTIGDFAASDFEEVEE